MSSASKSSNSTKRAHDPEVSKREHFQLTEAPETPYRLYRWRFVGMIGMATLNIAAGTNAIWFGPITNKTADEFGISVSQVNWLGNVVQIMFIPMALLTPALNKRLGMRYSCAIGTFFLLSGAWLHYAATPRTLSSRSSYALLLISQLLVGVSQPIFLSLGPKYSELWFDLKGRTTATMVISLCNPIGTALGQLLAPIVGKPRPGLLILAIITTGLALPALLIKDSPPTPPTFAGSKPTLGPMVTIRAMTFRERQGESDMTTREKVDFFILILGFGTYVGAIVVFTTLSNQILAPYGYSEDAAGFMGAALILSGLLAAVITAPIFDRILTNHLALTIKIAVPILGSAWLSMIWAVRQNNTAALYAVLVIIGIASLMILPVTLELASEVTRSSDTASAILWCFGNLFAFIFTLGMNGLKAGPNGAPSYNYKESLVFIGVFSFVVAFVIQFIVGKQARRKMDEEMNERSRIAGQRC